VNLWERRQCAAPHTSRAQKHVISQSLAPHVNVCCNLCYQCAFILHVWSPFRVCGASLQSIALGADFMNPKHQIHTQRCVGIAGSIQILWKGLLCMLSRSIALVIHNSRGEAQVSYHTHTKTYTHSYSRQKLALLWSGLQTHISTCQLCIRARARMRIPDRK
jgi:hypothetical protein